MSHFITSILSLFLMFPHLGNTQTSIGGGGPDSHGDLTLSPNERIQLISLNSLMDVVLVKAKKKWEKCHKENMKELKVRAPFNTIREMLDYLTILGVEKLNPINRLLDGEDSSVQCVQNTLAHYVEGCIFEKKTKQLLRFIVAEEIKLGHLIHKHFSTMEEQKAAMEYFKLMIKKSQDESDNSL